MRKNLRIALLFAALMTMAVILFLFFFSFTPPGYVFCVKYFGPRSPEKLIAYMTDPNAHNELMRLELIDVLVQRGADSKHRKELKEIAARDDMQGNLALFALIRLGDYDSHVVDVISSRWMGQQRSDFFVLSWLLATKLDSVRDLGFARVVADQWDAIDSSAKPVFIRSLRWFAYDDAVKSVLLASCFEGDYETRGYSIAALGDAARVDSRVRQDKEIPARLKSIIEDTETDYRLRMVALGSFAQYGWNPDSEKVVVKWLKSEPTDGKLRAIEALCCLGNPNRALLHLSRTLFYGDLEVFEFALLSIGIILITCFWWVPLAYLAFVVAMPIVLRQKLRRLSAAAQK